MRAKDQKVITIAALYRRLADICDSGFALAVHIRFTRPSLLYRTYSAEWTDTYNERGFMMADPTVRWGLTNVGSMDWTMLADQDTDGVLNAAREYGLQNGWSYATGPATSRSLGSMTKTTPFSDVQRDEMRGIIDDIHALTDGFDHLPNETQDALRAIG